MHADPRAAYAYRWFGRFGSRAAIDRSFDLFWRHLRRLGERFNCVVSANRHLSSRLRAGGVTGVATIPMGVDPDIFSRSEEHTSELQSLMRISYAVFCLKKKKTKAHINY